MLRTVGRRAAIVALVGVGVGCGDDGPNGPGGGDADFFRAQIDGEQFTSTLGTITTGVILVTPGVYALTGTQQGGYTLSMSLYNIGDEGTYPLGVGPQVPGGTLIATSGTGSWSTPSSGDAGTVEITTLTATRIAGTFTAILEAQQGSSPATRTVTEGAFDVEVSPQGEIGDLPANAGSKVSATLNGQPFNAAAAGGTYVPGPGLLTITGTNNAKLVNLTLSGINSVGAYPISDTRFIGVSHGNNASENSWSSTGVGSSGTISITLISATRIKGTFSGILGPAPGSETTSNLSVTNGVFDIGRQ